MPRNMVPAGKAELLLVSSYGSPASAEVRIAEPIRIGIPSELVAAAIVPLLESQDQIPVLQCHNIGICSRSVSRVLAVNIDLIFLAFGEYPKRQARSMDCRT